VEYTKYLAVTTRLREIIVDAIPQEYIEELRDTIVDYDMVLPFDLLQHVRKNIQLTTNDVVEMKATVFFTWDSSAETLCSFVNRMEKGAEGCARWSITIPEADLMQHLVMQIYAGKNATNDPAESPFAQLTLNCRYLVVFSGFMHQESDKHELTATSNEALTENHQTVHTSSSHPKCANPSWHMHFCHLQLCGKKRKYN
jgi:hypothetical protein